MTGMGMGVPFRILGESEFGKREFEVWIMEGWWVRGCLGVGMERRRRRMFVVIWIRFDIVVMRMERWGEMMALIPMEK